MAQELSWPVGLGIAIGTQAQIEEFDPEQTFKGTIPRMKATEEDVAAFETERGERLPSSYREFLLHADGWEQFYFTVDLFGIQELRGAGGWQHAQNLLTSYDAEEVLEESELEVTDLLPVAAGQGNDLIVVVREGRPNAGLTVWFDGGEYGRYDDFGDFFEEAVAMLRSWVKEISQPQGAELGDEIESEYQEGSS